MHKRKPTDTSETAILARVIAPTEATLSPDAAKSILSFAFPDTDRQRMSELSEKARQGILSRSEQEDADRYERIASFLGLLQSKARVSLRNATSQHA